MTTGLRYGTLLIGLTAVGCAGGTADVTGKVTYEGKPVGYGNVIVISSDGEAKYGPLQSDGSYRVTAVKFGEAKVAVSSPPPPGAVPAPKGGREGAEGEDKIPAGLTPPPVDQELLKRWFAIPTKYADPTKSGLTVNVGEKSPYDIALTK